MGWTWTNKPDYEDIKGFIFKVLKENNIIAISVKHNTAYVAYSPEPNTFEALIVLLRKDRLSKYNQGYKVIHEDCGPYHCDCPKYIINLLSPTNNPLANEWRNACLEHRMPDYQKIKGEQL